MEDNQAAFEEQRGHQQPRPGTPRHQEGIRLVDYGGG